MSRLTDLVRMILHPAPAKPRETVQGPTYCAHAYHCRECWESFHAQARSFQAELAAQARRFDAMFEEF